MEKQDLWEEIRFEIGSMNKSNNDEIPIGSGNEKADILFIGDDANLYETEDLKVKIGSSGEFLIKLCDLAEISPENYYITTLSKNKENFRKMFELHQEKLKELLYMQIALVEPKIIVCFGQDSAELLLKKEVNLKTERGNIIDWVGGIKVIITYDVNFAKKARESSDKSSKVAKEFWKDLKTVKNLLDEKSN